MNGEMLYGKDSSLFKISNALLDNYQRVCAVDVQLAISPMSAISLVFDEFLSSKVDISPVDNTDIQSVPEKIFKYADSSQKSTHSNLELALNRAKRLKSKLDEQVEVNSIMVCIIDQGKETVCLSPRAKCKDFSGS